MTPTEKAKQLVDKMTGFTIEDCIINARTCVQEIIDNCPFKDYGFKYNSISSRLDIISEYWEEVKEEINKL